MLKNIEAHDKVTVTRVIEIPVDIAAELFARSCRECFLCTLHSSHNKGQCPFNDKECRFITREDWEDYLNE